MKNKYSNLKYDKIVKMKILNKNRICNCKKFRVNKNKKNYRINYSSNQCKCKINKS
jgi:hypothetical protein